MFSKIGIKLAIILVVLCVLVAGKFYIQQLQAELGMAAERQARMSDVITGQQKAMDAVQNNIKEMQATQNELNGKVQEAEQGRRSLETKFNQTKDGQTRDLGLAANKEPERVEESINRGTKDAGRCNELVGGSSLTAEEKSGKVKNSICPDMLPAYTGPATSDTKPKSGAVFDPSKIKRAQ
jgi:hypothetical protein